MQEIGILVVAVIAGHQWHARLLHQRLGRGFAAHCRDRGDGWPHEGDARIGASLREAFVLRKEPVARMNGLGTRGERGLQDRVGLEIAVARGSAADMDSDITRRDVLGKRIRVRIDRYGADSESPRGRRDAASDFAAIGDQQSGKHSRSLILYMRNTPKRVSAMGAFSAADRPRPSTRRVSDGAITPSSHRRAVA